MSHTNSKESHLWQSTCIRFGLSIDPYAKLFPSVRSHLNHRNVDFSSPPSLQPHRLKSDNSPHRPARPTLLQTLGITEWARTAHVNNDRGHGMVNEPMHSNSKRTGLLQDVIPRPTDTQLLDLSTLSNIFIPYPTQVQDDIVQPCNIVPNAGLIA